MHLLKILFVENDDDVISWFDVENRTVQFRGSLAKHNCINTISFFIMKKILQKFAIFLKSCGVATNVIRNGCREAMGRQQSNMFPKSRYDK